jgi:hypothetical protein
MKTWLSLAAMVGLMACSQVPGSPYAGSNQPRVVPDGHSVTIVNVRNEQEAQPWAEAYCAKQGRAAHFIQMEMYRRQYHQPTDSASFDCVQA